MPIDSKNELAFAYKAIKLLNTDYEDMEAYEDGIIDSEGNRIIPHWSSLDQSEYKNYNIFVRLMILLKQVMEKLPAHHKKKIKYHQLLKTLREEVESVSNKGDAIEFIYELNDVLQKHFKPQQHMVFTDHITSVILEDEPVGETAEFIADCVEMELYEMYESMSVGGGMATGGGTGSELAGVSDAQVDPNKNTVVSPEAAKKLKKKNKKKQDELIKKKNDEKVRRIIDKL